MMLVVIAAIILAVIILPLKGAGKKDKPLKLVEGVLGCGLCVVASLRFAVCDQFLMTRRAEQFQARRGQHT